MASTVEDSIKKIKEFLEKNGFYRYLDDIPGISQNVADEFNEVAAADNKRNILLESPWSQLKNLGEARELLIIELGGSYLNLFDSQITADGKVEIAKRATIDFYDKSKLYTPDILFTDLIGHLDNFIPADRRGKIKDCVFIFTFPIEHFRRDDGFIDAIAVKINKNINHRDIVGMKVGETFEKYARNAGYDNMKVAVTNDSIPSLLAAKYEEISMGLEFDAALNIIVGTGTNISAGYDLHSDGRDKMYMVITEFGYFKSFPMSAFDDKFNETCTNKNESLAEKMISGLWQPYLFRIMVDEMIEAGILEENVIAAYGNLPPMGAEIEAELGNRKDEDAIRILDYIWLEQTRRGAFICGLAIASIMSLIYKGSDKERMHFGLVEVGGVLQKARLFHETMHKTLESELERLACRDKINYTKLNPENKSALGSAVFNSIMRQKP